MIKEVADISKGIDEDIKKILKRYLMIWLRSAKTRKWTAYLLSA